MDGPRGGVGDDAAIAALGDAETADRGADLTGNGFVEIGGGGG